MALGYCWRHVAGRIRFIFIFPRPPFYRAEASILADAKADAFNLRAATNNQDIQIDFVRLELLNERTAAKLVDIFQGVSINQRIVQKTYSYTVNDEKHNTDLLTFFDARTLRDGIAALLNKVEFDVERSMVVVTVKTHNGYRVGCGL